MTTAPETPLADTGRRRCLECARSFRPGRPSQVYCCERHRRTALMRRKRARESVQEPDPPAQLRCAELLEAAQLERQRIGRPPLEIDPFLQARALELEAEYQVRLWAERLRVRREAVSQLADPGGERSIKRLASGDVLLVPDSAHSVGVVSTDGRFGVVIYGAGS